VASLSEGKALHGSLYCSVPGDAGHDGCMAARMLAPPEFFSRFPLTRQRRNRVAKSLALALKWCYIHLKRPATVSQNLCGVRQWAHPFDEPTTYPHGGLFFKTSGACKPTLVVGSKTRESGSSAELRVLKSAQTAQAEVFLRAQSSELLPATPPSLASHSKPPLCAPAPATLLKK
jgi:hypothetical protein